MQRVPRRRVTILVLLICLVVILGSAPVRALGMRALDAGTSLCISTDIAYKTIKTGDTVVFNTTVTNNSEEESPQMFVAMNIIDLANVHSCAFIATDDVGKLYNNGSFEVAGRLDNSENRGCGLMLL